MRTPRAALEQAVDRENLILLYQPIHDLGSRRIVAAEALVRQERENGEVREAQIITEAAEQAPHDAMIEVDSILVRQALADAVRWHSAGATGVRLHLNLSAREFQEGDVTARLEKLITGCGMDVCLLSVELTETRPITDPEATTHVLREVKRLGCELWLDDFGSGNSTLEHLYYFPVDGLKLPSVFIREIDTNERGRAIVEKLIALAHQLDLPVIAEGVEREEQLEVLRGLGCDRIQGFLFSRPMRLGELMERVSPAGSADRGGAPDPRERSA